MADMTIASQVQAPKIDPLATIGQINTATQGILQNKLLGQQLQGKVALGEAVTSATDAKTGKTDWAKALGLLAQNPKGAFAVPEFAGQNLDRQIKELQLSQEQLKTAGAKWGAIGNLALSLVSGAKQQPLTKENVVGAIRSNLFEPGVLGQDDLEMAAAFINQLSDDPVKNSLALTRLYTQANATAEGLNTVHGAPQNVDTGPGILSMRTSPATGESTLGAFVPKGLTPEKMAELVEVIDPVTKERKKVTYGSLVQAGQIDKNGVPVGLAPGVSEAASAAATGSAKSAQELMEAADKAPQTKAALMNIRNQLQNFTPGPKANWTYMLGALATQLGVASPKVTEGVAAQEEFAKLATQFINQQVGALGGSGTDSKLESAMKGTPNDLMSKEGILGVTNLMMGLEDATLAKNGAWQKWLGAGNGPESYGKFQTEFNRLYNPRVFQSVYMSDKQRQTMLSQMSKTDRERFQKDWVLAKKAGWIQ